MKFTVTLKDSDGAYDGIRIATDESMKGKGLSDASPDEVAAIREKRNERLGDFAGKWLRYGEYADIEFDDEAGTARLIPVSEQE